LNFGGGGFKLVRGFQKTDEKLLLIR
jgi:hypothetical protein